MITLSDDERSALLCSHLLQHTYIAYPVMADTSRTCAILGSCQALPSESRDPCFQATRLVCVNDSTVVACDSSRLHALSLRTSGEVSTDGMYDDGNVARSRAYSVESLCTREFTDQSPMQSISMLEEKGILLSVNSRGVVGTTQLTQTLDSEESIYPFVGETSFSDSECREDIVGWAGVAGIDDLVSTVHYLRSNLVVHDLGTLSVIRSSMMPCNPTSIAALKGSSGLVAVGDRGGNLSVWDHRQAGKGGCVHRSRCSGSNGGPLWSVLPSGDGTLAVAGADKAVHLLDTRTWRTRVKWRSPNKFDIIRLLRSKCAESGDGQGLPLYVAGRDNEVLLCRVHASAQSGKAPAKKRKMGIVQQEEQPESGHAALASTSKLRLSHHRGIRAEFFWSGLDVVSRYDSKLGKHSDRLVGLCGRGKIYVVDNANHMKVAEDVIE